jgi:hypothetical protein
MSQEYEDKLTLEDLMYIRITIATFQANLDMKVGMPKTYASAEDQ